MTQVTALIDANNFYASCEQSLDPALLGRPVVVCNASDNLDADAIKEIHAGALANPEVILGSLYHHCTHDSTTWIAAPPC